MLNLGPYSTKEFPNIRVYPTIIDRILEGVAVLLAIAAWVCAIWVYIHIEDKITANFSFMSAGSQNAMSRYSILWQPVLLVY